MYIFKTCSENSGLRLVKKINQLTIQYILGIMYLINNFTSLQNPMKAYNVAYLQSIRSACPSSAINAINWSMIPHGIPANSCSAFWQTKAFCFKLKVWKWMRSMCSLSLGYRKCCISTLLDFFPGRVTSITSYPAKLPWKSSQFDDGIFNIFLLLVYLNLFAYL